MLTQPRIIGRVGVMLTRDATRHHVQMHQTRILKCGSIWLLGSVQGGPCRQDRPAYASCRSGPTGPRAAQVIPDCHLACLQRHKIPAGTMRMNIPPGIGAHPAGATDKDWTNAWSKRTPHAPAHLYAVCASEGGHNRKDNPSVAGHNEKDILDGHACPAR